MNEELIDKMFQDAVSKGYSEDKNSFISLLNSDNEVFYDMYSRFAQGQMNKDQFRSVITPKKKRAFASWLAENPTYKWLKACPIFG
jgi:hypothetical protein